MNVDSNYGNEDYLIKKIEQKVSKAHIPPAIAIRGHTTLIGKREKMTNKGTDRQYVAEFSIDSTTCHI